MTNYEKGAKAEREAKKLLEMLGYHAVRSAGSKGTWDIVAIYTTHIRLIQVKVEGAMTPVEYEAIKEFEVSDFCSKEVWTRLANKPADERWDVEVVK